MNTALLQSLVSFVQARRAASERGASVVEYALLVSLIAMVCLGAVTLLGGNIFTNMSTSASKIQIAGS